MIELYAPCLPPTMTAQHKGVKRVAKTDRNRRGLVFFRKDEMEQTRKMYARALSPHRPEQPLTGPVGLMLGILFPHTKATLRSPARAATWIWHAGRPDFDNAAKEVCDVLQATGFYGDDSQIVAGMLMKLRVPPAQAGLYVRLVSMSTTAESPAVARMRAKIAAVQAANPAPDGYCVSCWFRDGHAIPVTPGALCGFCDTLNPAATPPPAPEPLEIVDLGDPIDPDDLFC